ncbi:SCO family protein [Pseudomonas cavernae]|uniref:SCO family protein n=1 Tax=Pseudomonas cavernae TaxID=2320867 RepID=A0A385YXL1_9PSED|nr:SCO family protein [Pseudomonas cavernae]AYC31191.1 SCO family protein [Pseudomonas cavernae]
MNTRRNILAGLGTAALGLAAWHAGKGLEQTAPAAPRPDNAGYFPNVRLYTHEGKAVRFYDDLIRNKVVAINMMYTACGDRCPTMTANLLAVQRMLGERAGRDVFMYSLTLQPELDTPEVLKAYADKYRIKPGWQFLTGAPEDIERLRFKLGFYDIDPLIDGNKASHTGMVRIGNDHFNRWSMAPALADPRQIFATLNHLDHRVAQTGSAADPART